VEFVDYVRLVLLFHTLPFFFKTLVCVAKDIADSWQSFQNDWSIIQKVQVMEMVSPIRFID
jgi:hypothetical protein